MDELIIARDDGVVLEYANAVAKRPPPPPWHAHFASVVGVFAALMAMTHFVWLGVVLLVANVGVEVWTWTRWRRRCRQQRAFAFAFFWAVWCRSWANTTSGKHAAEREGR